MEKCNKMEEERTLEVTFFAISDWEIHDSIVDYFYEVTQQKLKDLCGDRDTSQLSEEEIKKLDKL